MSEGSDRDRGPDDKQFGAELIPSSLMEMLPDAATHGDGSLSPISSLFLLPELDDTERHNGSSWWTDIPYPGSGYTQLSIILLAFFITCIMILIVVGNLLVCIAISTEKSLKTVQNWFIASLAVSDLLLGCVIMPFSLAYELMGYWIFGRVWCEVSPPAPVTRLPQLSLPRSFAACLSTLLMSDPSLFACRSIMRWTSFSAQHPSTTCVSSVWIVTGP